MTLFRMYYQQGKAKLNQLANEVANYYNSIPVSFPVNKKKGLDYRFLPAQGVPRFLSLFE